MAKERERDYEAGGVAFVGCILLGVGLGLWVGQPAPGVLTGLGVGFLVMAAFSRKGTK